MFHFDGIPEIGDVVSAKNIVALKAAIEAGTAKVRFHRLVCTHQSIKYSILISYKYPATCIPQEPSFGFTVPLSILKNQFGETLTNANEQLERDNEELKKKNQELETENRELNQKLKGIHSLLDRR